MRLFQSKKVSSHWICHPSQSLIRWYLQFLLSESALIKTVLQKYYHSILQTGILFLKEQLTTIQSHRFDSLNMKMS